MTEQPIKERGKPGRKVETPQQRLERLERELAAARRAAEEAEQRKLATIGAAVLAEAEGNATYMTELRRILRARVATKTGKADIAAILGAASAEAA